MNGIRISLIELLLRGIPESLLIMAALHIFTKTKITMKRYLLMSLLQVAIVYIVRLLPIAMGMNTIFSLIIAVVIFPSIHGSKMTKTIQTIIAAAVSLMLLAVSEALNIGVLILLHGYEETENLMFQSGNLQKVLYSVPSLFFWAILILISSVIMKKMDGKKTGHGKTGKTTGA